MEKEAAKREATKTSDEVKTQSSAQPKVTAAVRTADAVAKKSMFQLLAANFKDPFIAALDKMKKLEQEANEIIKHGKGEFLVDQRSIAVKVVDLKRQTVHVCHVASHGTGS